MLSTGLSSVKIGSLWSMFLDETCVYHGLSPVVQAVSCTASTVSAIYLNLYIRGDCKMTRIPLRQTLNLYSPVTFTGLFARSTTIPMHIVRQVLPCWLLLFARNGSVHLSCCSLIMETCCKVPPCIVCGFTHFQRWNPSFH